MKQAAGPDKKPRTGRNGSQSAVRVMIVDDSITVRTAFRRIIDATPDLVVSTSASSAEVAIDRLRDIAVDVILLDLDMPGMGGLEALPKLLASANEAKILVVSSLTEEGAEHTLAALSMGAADTMLKPRTGEFGADYRSALTERVRALGRESRSLETSKSPPTRLQLAKRGKRPRLLAIGASTGGIHALNQFLLKLPPQFDLPILVTQHLPASFVPVFARQLEVAGARATMIADDGMTIRPRTIIVAPGHAHMLVRKRPSGIAISLSIEPAESGCMPSVDPMLDSIAEACDGEAMGVILSGMGRDGVNGAQKLVQLGGTILAQDAPTSAVWGMPRAVVERGLASAVLPPDELAAKVLESVGAASWT